MASLSCRVLDSLTCLVALMHAFSAAISHAETVQASRRAVATGHPEATAAGLAVLCHGGNAIDTAVAAPLTLVVA